MNVPNQTETCITGVGVTSAIARGKADFSAALLQGKHAFGIMERAGRRAPSAEPATSFLGAEIPALSIPGSIPRKLLRTVSFSGQAALATLEEAWSDANLDDVDPFRIGLIIGGSNFQQRELSLAHDKYKDSPNVIRPTYGVSFLDSDLCGLCTQFFGIRGFAYTLGAASASGQVAVLQARAAVASGQVDVCIALGALMDLSYWECQAFRKMGAMGSDKFANDPARAARPFDRDRDGFIFGESCGAIVIERTDSNRRPEVQPYARLTGGAMVMDRNRNPNPSLEGEIKVIQDALKQAGLAAKDIDYINPHGTGSRLGDETELAALQHCDLGHAFLNATKSITGHGLSSAGNVELIATLLQMKAATLHPTRNLDNPMEPGFNWVGTHSVPHQINNALKMSMGFGGVNSAICLQGFE